MHWPFAIVRSGRVSRRAGRAESVHERGQHRRVQPSAPGRRAVESAADGQQVESLGDRPGDERRRQSRIGPGVGVEGDHPVGRSPRRCPVAAPTPCRPSRRAAVHRRSPSRRPDVRARRWRRSTGRRRRSPRPRRARRRSQSSSGPIRSASSRAGITTLIDCIGVSVGRTGAATAAASRESRLIGDAASGDARRPIDDSRSDPAADGHREVLGDHVGDDLGAGRHERQAAAGVARPADEVQPRSGPTVGRADERRSLAVRRRAVDRAARRAVAAVDVGRRHRVAELDPRAQVDAAVGETVEHEVAVGVGVDLDVRWAC